jgi:hypothetical protein
MMKIVATIAVSACAAGFSDACGAHSPNVITPEEVGPGVYGIVDVGDGPQPPLLKPEPVTVVRTLRHKALDAVYVHVPPAQAMSWGRYCYRYRACHRPVYFVTSREYGPDYRRGSTYAEAR